MEFYGFIYIIAFFILISLLVIEGYLRQRERDWRRICEEHGKPNVNSIKELKIYIQKEKNQSHGYSDSGKNLPV